MKRFFFIFSILIVSLPLFSEWSDVTIISPITNDTSVFAGSFLVNGPGKCVDSYNNDIYVVYADQYFQDLRTNIFFHNLYYYNPLDTIVVDETFYPAGIGGAIEEWCPVVAAGRDGSRMILWSDVRTGIFQIAYRYYNGFSWDSIGVLHYEEDIILQNYPDIVWNDNGYHAVFERRDGPLISIAYSMFSTDNMYWSDIVTISDSVSRCCRPSVALYNDIMMCGWFNIDSGGIYYNVYNNGWGEEKRFPYDGYYPFIMSDNMGNFYAVYTNYEENGTQRIYFSKFNGDNWEINYPISSSFVNSYMPKGYYKNGKIHIVWTSDGATTSSVLLYRNYDIYNNNWSPIETVKVSYGGLYDPAVTVDDNDNIYVFWTDYSDTTQRYNPDIYCRVKYNISKEQYDNSSYVQAIYSNNEVVIKSSYAGYLYMFDITGRLLWKHTCGDNSVINVKKDLSQGIYLVVLRTTDNKIFKTKVEIVK